MVMVGQQVVKRVEEQENRKQVGDESEEEREVGGGSRGGDEQRKVDRRRRVEAVERERRRGASRRVIRQTVAAEKQTNRDRDIIRHIGRCGWCSEVELVLAFLWVGVRGGNGQRGGSRAKAILEVLHWPLWGTVEGPQPSAWERATVSTKANRLRQLTTSGAFRRMRVPGFGSPVYVGHGRQVSPGTVWHGHQLGLMRALLIRHGVPFVTEEELRTELESAGYVGTEPPDLVVIRKQRDGTEVRVAVEFESVAAHKNNSKLFRKRDHLRFLAERGLFRRAILFVAPQDHGRYLDIFEPPLFAVRGHGDFGSTHTFAVERLEEMEKRKTWRSTRDESLRRMGRKAPKRHIQTTPEDDTETLRALGRKEK